MIQKRHKILFFIWGLGGGGAEKQLSCLLNKLSRSRFESHLCVCKPVFVYQPPPDVPVYVLKAFPPRFFVRAFQFSRLIDQLKPDLIFNPLYSANAFLRLSLILSRHQPKWISRVSSNPCKVYQFHLNRFIVGRINKFVSVLNGIGEALVDHYGIDTKKISVIHNGTDLDTIDKMISVPLDIKKKENVYVFVHVGRQSKEKNQQMLIQAFARFTGRPAELWMIGDGPLRGKLQAYAKNHGLANQIRWFGFQKNPFPYVHAADCFVLTSNFEGYPNVILEALICGIPVISTQCFYGPSELIKEGMNGFLVPMNNPEALGKVMEEMFQNPSLGKTLKANCRSYALEKLCNHDFVSQYENLFEEVMFKTDSN